MVWNNTKIVHRLHRHTELSTLTIQYRCYRSNIVYTSDTYMYEKNPPFFCVYYVITTNMPAWMTVVYFQHVLTLSYKFLREERKRSVVKCFCHNQDTGPSHASHLGCLSPYSSRVSYVKKRQVWKSRSESDWRHTFIFTFTFTPVSSLRMILYYYRPIDCPSD